MGFLNAKERIFDTIITEQGRNALAHNGSLGIEFVSFTDEQAVYNDVTSSIYIHFEAPGFRHKDIITFIPKEGAGSINMSNIDYSVVDGKLINPNGAFITGSDFVLTSTLFLSKSLDNIEANQIINTDDEVFSQNTFKLNNTSIIFPLTDNSPIGKFQLRTANIDDLESFFQDRKLAHHLNYQYLPPIIRNTSGASKLLGMFANVGQQAFDVESLQTVLTNKPMQTIYMDETSAARNVIAQMFEIRNDKIRVLDVVDFGLRTTSADGSHSHIFFIGKILTDSFGSDTFINLFTLVFE